MNCLVGIDIGTSAAKAVLIDETGREIAAATSAYPLATPQPLWAEQDPEHWWLGAVACLREVLTKGRVRASEVAGLGLSGQMHGLVLLDQAGEVLRPAILWNDQRTGPQCDALTRQLGLETLLAWTGNPVLPGFTLPKLLWVRENEPEIFRRTARFLLPKDYVRYRLTGEMTTEVSDASGTSLFDVARRRWSDDMFNATRIPRAWAPPSVESTTVAGRIHAKAAAATGLTAGTPVVAGGGDQASQAIGTGLYREGRVAVSLGTSGVVFAPTARPLVDTRGRLHTFCHAAPGLWHVMGVMLAAGGSFRWYRDVFGKQEKTAAATLGVDPYELMTAEAAKAPPGCEGLLFLPYLSGERTPHPDPRARGAFLGLSLRHEKAHTIRAVLEGVCFGLRDSFELIRELGLIAADVRVSGGGARSPLWRQILADVLATPVATINVVEGASLGAALLAGVGVGLFPDVGAACEAAVREGERHQPRPAETQTYRDLYRIYRDLYPTLRPVFEALAAD